MVYPAKVNSLCEELSYHKTHQVIFFVRTLHSKRGMESYCWSNIDLLIIVGLWCYNQSGVTELLIMRDPHYGRHCFRSVKTLPSELYILSCGKGLWPRPSASAFSAAKNVELLGLHLCWIYVKSLLVKALYNVHVVIFSPRHLNN